MSYKLNATNADCYEGTTTLINKLGIQDEKQLQENESIITTFKAAELIQQPLKPDFGFADYCGIHKALFDTLYDWENCEKSVYQRLQPHLPLPKRLPIWVSVYLKGLKNSATSKTFPDKD